MQMHPNAPVHLLAETTRSVGGRFGATGSRAWRTLGIAAAVLCLAVLAAGCGSSDSGSDAGSGSGSKTTEPAKAPVKLPGSSWDLVSYRATDGKTVDADASAPASLAFAAVKLSGTTGCNDFNGTYKASGTSLTITMGAMTQKACTADAANQQEAALTASLPKVDSYALDGDNLVLQQGGKTLITYAPGRTTVVGKWSVTGINNGKEAVVSTSDVEKLTAEFTEDGNFSGSGGCNQLSGGYTTSGSDGIEIGPLAATMMACEGAAGEVEAQYTAALQAATTWEISGTTLTLRDASGATQVIATAAS